MRCPDCKGEGHVVLLISRTPCRACGGTGAVPDPGPADSPYIKARRERDASRGAEFAAINQKDIGGIMRSIQRDIQDLALKRGHYPTLVRTSPELLDAIIEDVTGRPSGVVTVRNSVQIFGIPVEADEGLRGVCWILS